MGKTCSGTIGWDDFTWYAAGRDSAVIEIEEEAVIDRNITTQTSISITNASPNILHTNLSTKPRTVNPLIFEYLHLATAIPSNNHFLPASQPWQYSEMAPSRMNNQQSSNRYGEAVKILASCYVVDASTLQGLHYSTTVAGGTSLLPTMPPPKLPPQLL